MRLVRCDSLGPNDSITLTFDEFFGERLPSYAILSHTWGDDEVLFADVQQGTAMTRGGYGKLLSAITQAQIDGLDYIWVDTCCIDKSSSAELTEAINSMFEWYSRADICYVHLDDLHPDEHTFSSCRWFTRGWCLQELIAPTTVVFYRADWTYYGHKSNLCAEIAQITGIDSNILSFNKELESMSIAQRMSWAARRKTTRVEDMAYCLMGIFSVNMPLLYGEGTKAFLRLQEEIIKTSDDHTIFAWSEWRDSYEHGILADSPAAFATAQRTVRYESSIETEPFQMTNRGLRIRLALEPHNDMNEDGEETHFLAALECPVPRQGFNNNLAILLRRTSRSSADEYVRIKCSTLFDTQQRGQYKTIYVRQQQPLATRDIVCPVHYAFIKPPLLSHKFKTLDVKTLRPGRIRSGGKWTKEGKPLNVWLPSISQQTFNIHKQAGRVSAAFLLHFPAREFKFVLLLGSLTDLELGWDIIPWQRKGSLDSLQLLELSFTPQPTNKTTKTLNDIYIFSVAAKWRIVDNQKRYEITLLGWDNEEKSTLPQPEKPRVSSALTLFPVRTSRHDPTQVTFASLVHHSPGQRPSRGSI